MPPGRAGRPRSAPCGRRTGRREHRHAGRRRRQRHVPGPNPRKRSSRPDKACEIGRLIGRETRPSLLLAVARITRRAAAAGSARASPPRAAPASPRRPRSRRSRRSSRLPRPGSRRSEWTNSAKISGATRCRPDSRSAGASPGAAGPIAAPGQARRRSSIAAADKERPSRWRCGCRARPHGRRKRRHGRAAAAPAIRASAAGGLAKAEQDRIDRPRRGFFAFHRGALEREKG